MTQATAALRAGAAALLEASGERDLASLVTEADVEIAGAGEPWTMGSRSVTAHRAALVVDAPAYVALSTDAQKLSAVRAAFSAAMRTPDTELLDLLIVLRLPAIRRGWHWAYREAPPQASLQGHSSPEPTAVLGGAAALLAAMGDATAAAMLARASLDVADVPSAGATRIVRYLLRLAAADRAASLKDAALAERLRRAVHDAGARAAETVAAVDLASALGPSTSAAAGPESRLIRALAAKGVTAVPVARGEDPSEVTLALIGGGEVRLVDVVTGGAAALSDPRSPRKSARVASYVVSALSINDDASAEETAAALCEGLPL